MSIPIKQTKEKHFWIWCGVIIIIIGIGGLTFFLNCRTHKKNVNNLVLRKPMNLLLIGMDINVDSPGSDPKAITRTDTLILAILNPYNSKISLVSIPRDSLVDIPGHGVDRINCASVLGGYNLTKRMVTRLTGYRIDHYAVVNFQTFKDLVDLLEGVWINVDKKMRYANDYGIYTIKLDPGWQLLNGDKALQYVRFRHEALGDIGRVNRQRNLLMAVFKKMIQPVNILKWPRLLKTARKDIITDLSTGDIFQLMNFARTVKNKAQNFNTYTLPGNFYEAYWKPDRQKVAELMNQLKPKPLIIKKTTQHRKKESVAVARRVAVF